MITLILFAAMMQRSVTEVMVPSNDGTCVAACYLNGATVACPENVHMCSSGRGGQSRSMDVPAIVVGHHLGCIKPGEICMDTPVDDWGCEKGSGRVYLEDVDGGRHCILFSKESQ